MRIPRFTPALALATVVSGFFAASLVPTADARLIRWRTLFLTDPTPLPGDEPYVPGENQGWPFLLFDSVLPVSGLSYYNVNGRDVTSSANSFEAFVACFDIDPDTQEVVYFYVEFGSFGESQFASLPYGCGVPTSYPPPTNEVFASSGSGKSWIRFTGRRSTETGPGSTDNDDYLLLQFDSELTKDGGVVGIIPFDPTYETSNVPYLDWLVFSGLDDLSAYVDRSDGGSVFVQDAGNLSDFGGGIRFGDKLVGGLRPSMVSTDYSSTYGRMVLVGTPAPIQPDIAEPFYTLDSADVNLLLDRFNNEEIAADLDDNDEFDFFDLQIYLDAIE